MKAITVVSAIALLSSTSLIFPTVSHGEERICNGSLGAITVVNLKVPDGATCRLTSTKIQGNVVVGARSTLIATRIRVGGSIQSENSTRVNVSSSPLINGNIEIVQGRSSSLISNKVNGKILFDSNKGSLIARSNIVGSDLQAFQNTGGVNILTNQITGNLQCLANTPAPVGGSNIVGGNKENQCALL